MPSLMSGVWQTYRRSGAGARGSQATDKPVCCNTRLGGAVPGSCDHTLPNGRWPWRLGEQRVEQHVVGNYFEVIVVIIELLEA